MKRKVKNHLQEIYDEIKPFEGVKIIPKDAKDEEVALVLEIALRSLTGKDIRELHEKGQKNEDE